LIIIIIYRQDQAGSTVFKVRENLKGIFPVNTAKKLLRLKTIANCRPVRAPENSTTVIISQVNAYYTGGLPVRHSRYWG